MDTKEMKIIMKNILVSYNINHINFYNSRTINYSIVRELMF